MKYIRFIQWILLFLPNLAFSLFCILISPIAALYLTPDRKHLISPFTWLETVDNDLSGDDGWKQEHLWGSNPLSYINITRWLIRNGGNKISYGFFGCPMTPFQTTGFYSEDCNGYWLYRRPIQITQTRFIDFFIGWNLPGAKFDRVKYACSFRLKTKL